MLCARSQRVAVGQVEAPVARFSSSPTRVRRVAHWSTVWGLAWVLVATLAWALSPTPPPVAAQEEPSFDVRPVGPLPSSAGDEDLGGHPEGDFSDPIYSPTRALLADQQREEVDFDPTKADMVESLTTPTRQVYENPDGSRTAVMSPEPVRYEEDGDWVEIDLSLEETLEGDLAPVAAPTDLVIPATPSDGVAVHHSAAGPISIGTPSVVTGADGPTVEETAAGPDAASVEGAAGVASVVTPLSTGFEHDVVFPSRASASSSFTVELDVPAGVLARQDPSGVALVRGEQVLSTYGGGVAFDAIGAQDGGRETPVRTTLLGQAGTRVTVQVAIDAAWLARPDREFPVTVDPTYTSVIEVNGGNDTMVNSNQPTVGYNSATDLRIGKATDGSIYRTFLRFGLAGVPAGAVILDADMQLRNIESTNCTAQLVRTRYSNSFSTAMTWNTQPTTGGVVVDANYAHGATGCATAWESHDIKDAVTGWYDGTLTNNGLRLTADEVTTAGYKRYSSSQAGSSVAPKVVVTYDRLVPVPAQVTPADGARVPTLTPTLTVNAVTDLDGDPVQYYFQVWSGEGLPWDGQLTNSGFISSTSWTVPAGVLSDGVTYSWSVMARGGTSAFPITSTTSRTVTTDRRLQGDPAPIEDVGPVGVNLVTGDASYTADSPGVSTIGGGIAPAYSYHSSVTPRHGLTGEYFVDANSNNAFDDGAALVMRNDSQVYFDWSTVSPFDTLPNEQFMVRWTGFITVPTTGTYYFGGAGSNGYKVIVNGTTLVNRWPTSWSALPVYGSSMSLTAGQTVPVTVEMVDSAGFGAWMELSYKTSGGGDSATVPAAWLSPARQAGEELSLGWELDLGGEAPRWESALVTNDSIVVHESEGTSLEFHRTPGGGFTADDGSSAVLALAVDGQVTLQDSGTTYLFGPDGELRSATDGPSADSTAPMYTWSSVATGGITYRRITTVTDPVSGRDVDVTWRLPGASCPTAPGGFDVSPPTGALCAVDYWDGTSTSYFYEGGQLARIVDPGGATTDFGYAGGLLTSVRDVLGHDAVAAGARADDATTTTEITYSSGRAVEVVLPAATVGATRSETTFTYGSGTTDVATIGVVNGSGYTRRVGYDASGRLTTDTDVMARTTSSSWNPAVDEQLWSRTGPDSLRTTYIYDADGNLADEYGPAPSTWFGVDRLPLPAHVADVPHRHVESEDPDGLLTTWYPSGTLTGPPQALVVGVGGSWPTSPTGTTPFSGRLTGTVTTGAAGTYAFTLTKNARARLWIDGRLVVDGWAAPGNASGSFGPTTSSGERHEIRIDLASAPSGTTSLTMAWTPPGGSSTPLPAANLSPELGNLTSTSADGHVETVTYAGTGNNGAEDGMPATVTADPGGESLETSYTYEPDGTGWQRMVTKTLPAGNTWAYAYYGGSEVRDNPCTPAADPVSQGGRQKTQTAPTAADATTRVKETVYDDAGRIVASRVGSGGWTCTTWDDRSRPVEVVHPAFGGAGARTVTYDWAIAGNPLESSASDPAGTLTTGVDLLGRAITTSDVWGTTTEGEFDVVDRPISVEFTAGGVTWVVETSYALDGQATEVTLDGEVIASMGYDAQRRLETVSHPNGPGEAGNGTHLDLGYDVRSRLNALGWEGPGATPITSDVVAYDVDGKVTDESIDGVDATPSGPSFAYDGAGRLTSAVLAERDPSTGVPTGTTRTLVYGFAATGACGALATAGLNTNRTTLVEDGSTVASYCYDAADRLTSTTDPGYTSAIAYDAHGNTTSIAGETRLYDGADRHRQTSDGTTTVGYDRDATDRIVERKVNGVTAARYSYAGPGDVSSAVLDGSGNLVMRSLGLPGGATYTDGGPGTSSSWTHPNVHGDTAAVTDGSGAKQGTTRAYEPHGAPIGPMATTGVGSFDPSWLGQSQRLTDHTGGLRPTVEMGARQYDPTLGRFLEVDPVEAGSANDYDYAMGDPINNRDLDGTVTRTFRTGWRRLSYVPAILTISYCVQLVCYGLNKAYDRDVYVNYSRLTIFGRLWRVHMYRELKAEYRACPGYGFGPIGISAPYCYHPSQTILWGTVRWFWCTHLVARHGRCVR